MTIINLMPTHFYTKENQHGFTFRRNGSHEHGFTLVELLVVVVVIGVLSGLILSIINTQGLRGRSRDAQRIADLKKIQAGLELYFADERRYPISRSNGQWENLGLSTSNLPDAAPTGLGNVYMNEVPNDPLFNSGASGGDAPCANPTAYRYNYVSRADGSEYVLTANMEDVDTITGNGCNSTDINNWGESGWVSGIWCVPTTNCYGVENP